MALQRILPIANRNGAVGRGTGGEMEYDQIVDRIIGMLQKKHQLENAATHFADSIIRQRPGRSYVPTPETTPQALPADNLAKA